MTRAQPLNVAPAFTPGPWAVDTAAYAGMDGIVSYDIIATGLEDGANGVAIVPIGAFTDRDPRREANARLIAAAPELYEALAEAHRALLHYEWYANPPSGWAAPDSKFVRHMTDAALAKARGETVSA